MRHIDILVTDILMPEVEEIEFVLSARRQGYERPIITMTGGSARQVAATSNYDYLKMARQLGATFTLRKPFTRQRLLDEVEVCLSEANNGLS